MCFVCCGFSTLGHVILKSRSEEYKIICYKIYKYKYKLNMYSTLCFSLSRLVRICHNVFRKFLQQLTTNIMMHQKLMNVSFSSPDVNGDKLEMKISIFVVQTLSTGFFQAKVLFLSQKGSLLLKKNLTCSLGRYF